MPVEQDNRRAVPTVAYIDRCGSDVDQIGREALEHVSSLPGQSLYTRFDCKLADQGKPW